jgi:predicted regulator of Ras-like GTPase activity (Roadblock/LC7/MglB family)
LQNSRLLGNRKHRVKESETSELLFIGVQQARYRYYSIPPSTIWLRLGDIAGQVPEVSRLPAFDPEHCVELSCEDVFGGPIPRIPLSRLAEIADEHLRLDGGPDFLVTLPAARVALVYRLVEKRELLEEVQPTSDNRDTAKAEDFAPALQISRLEEGPLQRDEAIPTGNTEPPQEKIAAAAGVQHSDPAETVTLRDSPAFERAKEPSAAPEAAISPASAEVRESHQAPPQQETPPSTAASPILSTTMAEGPENSPAALPHSDEQPPKTYADLASSEVSLGPAEPVLAESRAESTKESAQTAVREAVLIEPQDLVRSELKPAAKIPEQDTLQAIFMTEESLSIERVVELCGGLPGIRSCVLAHGAAVLAAHNAPESIDLVSLSAHALEMLAAIRQSAARMGVGAVPAVTIHSEKGPITFFHQDDLCLLVLRKDRGFVPGVREKLQQVIEHLSRANLALPGGVVRSALSPGAATF